jgi:hypothetical protein
MVVQSMLLSHMHMISVFMLIVVLFSSFDLELRDHFYTEEEEPINSEKDPVNSEKDEKLKGEIFEDKIGIKNDDLWDSVFILSSSSKILIDLFSSISQLIKAHAIAYHTFEFSYTYAPRSPPLIQASSIDRRPFLIEDLFR